MLEDQLQQKTTVITSVSSQTLNRNFCRIRTAATFISSRASLMAIQLRGPAPNGR